MEKDLFSERQESEAVSQILHEIWMWVGRPVSLQAIEVRGAKSLHQELISAMQPETVDNVITTG
jgi:hypothetical protein